MTGRARVAVLTRRDVERKVWQASQYEFEDVVDEIDDVRLIRPRRRPNDLLGGLAHGTLNRVGRRLGRDRTSLMRPPIDAPVDSDLFFAVFAAPHEIGALPHVRSQLARSKRRVAFIVEMYTSDLANTSDYIRQLRGFDHVFVFTRDVLPAVRTLSGAPASYLSTGVDALRFAPSAPAPPRSWDVVSYGRRLDASHRALRRAQDEGSLAYEFDTVRGVFEVSDHRDHRVALASRLQRASLALIYKNNDEPARIARTAGEETLTNRFFEATAAGAVMIGSRPDVADFDTAFPWPDALIPVAAPDEHLDATVARLLADGPRLAAASAAGIAAGLRRHDWSHRWSVILDAVGLAPHERLSARQTALAERYRELQLPLLAPRPPLR